MASSVPAAKAALIAALQANATVVADGIPVLWGGPTKVEDWATKRELIHLARVEQTEEWGSLGGGRRDEDYTIDVVFLVTQHGQDEQAAEERAWALRDELESILQDDPKLDGTLSRWASIERTVQENDPLEDGWATRLTVTVRCLHSGL